jgi:class 3 adenylate cyclase
MREEGLCRREMRWSAARPCPRSPTYASPAAVSGLPASLPRARPARPGDEASPRTEFYTRAMIVCPNCGEGNPERARFCLACGTELTATTTAGEERKVVSVLFVDLVGFTARSDKADPEDVRATLRPYHTRVSREIERFGGTVEKFVGDAVMAVFGAPLAHEDDAERAVRSALRILDAITALNEEHGLDLAVRAAVATGEAVVSLDAQPGTGEGIATGDVVNTAARLQSEAPVGGLVVNEQTFRRTRDTIDYDKASPVALKGKAEPVPLWRAVRVVAGRGGSLRAAGLEAPFTGRDRELRLVKELFHATAEERRARWCRSRASPASASPGWPGNSRSTSTDCSKTSGGTGAAAWPTARA